MGKLVEVTRTKPYEIEELFNGLNKDDKSKLADSIIRYQETMKVIEAKNERAKKDRNLRFIIAAITACSLISVAIITVPNIFTHFFSNATGQKYAFNLPVIPKEITGYDNENWYSEAVGYLSSYGIDLDYNKDRDIVRYELAEWLVKVFIQPEDGQYLKIAKDLELITSKSTNDYISRNETAEMILIFFSKLGVHIPETPKSETIYHNEDKETITKINKGAKRGLIELAEKGIIKGSQDKSLMPESSLTRLELAQIFYNLIKRFNEHSVL